MMIPFISGEELRAKLPYPKVAEALKRAFDSGITAPPRHVHSMGGAEAEKLLALMPSWSEAHGLVGLKLFTYFPNNRQIDLPVIHSLYIAVDGQTGMVRAIIDGGMLTNIRTASLSALAATYLARPDSRTLLVVGTGELASHLALAHTAVQSLKRVLVWGRRLDAARDLAHSLSAQGLDAEAVESLQEGLSAADVVVAATSSTSPLIKRCDVKAGTHLSLLGGFTPKMREVDDDLVASARIVLETIEGVSSTAGDIVGPLSSGAIQRSQLTAELRDLVSGAQPGRQSPQQITLFKSVGDAREDMCAAALALAP
jgi:ornithine cyclodeaminase